MNQKRMPDLQKNKMAVMPLGRLLFNMALPIIIAMLVQAFYNVVDSIYVSRISESAVTALSLAFPIQNMQIGFAIGIGVGVNSLLSKSLGEGNQENANRAAGNGVFLVLIATAIFMLFGLFGARKFYTIQSHVEETVESGTVYVQLCCLLTAGVFVEILGERLLQSSGRTIFTLITQGTGALINILLDPVFIFGYFGLPAMGIAGAALATVAGQWTAAIMTVLFNLKYNREVHFTFHYIKPHREIVSAILMVGVPSIIMMAIGSVMSFGMNQILQGFHETATSVFGIYYKLQSLFFMPVFGINNASISILAFNYGAKNPGRIMGTLKRAAATAFCVMVAGLLAFQLIPDLLLGAFNPSPQFLELGRKALRIISLHFPVAAFCIVLSALFQALGNGIYSTINALCRQLLVLLPAAYLLSLTGDVNAVWWSFPIAEAASLLVSGILFVRIYRRKIRPLYGEKTGKRQPC